MLFRSNANAGWARAAAGRLREIGGGLLPSSPGIGVRIRPAHRKSLIPPDNALNHADPMQRLSLLAGLVLSTLAAWAADPWVTYEPPAGSASGKHIVLFSQDANGTINPNNSPNVPGMQLLAGADLVVNQFRFRELPDADEIGRAHV